MGLKDDEPGVDDKDDAVGQDAVLEGAHLVVVQRDHVGKEKDNGELRHLGGLELLPQEEDPPVGAVTVGHEVDDDQHDDGNPEGQPGEPVPDMVIPGGEEGHRRKTQPRPHQLAGDVMEAVPLVVVGVGVAGGEHQHQAADQQRQHQHQKGEVDVPLGPMDGHSSGGSIRDGNHLLCIIRSA